MSTTLNNVIASTTHKLTTGVVTTGTAPIPSIYEGGTPLASALTQFLIQLIIVVILCKVLGFFFKYIRQPPVIAEVVSGILLGPSAFGYIPGFTANIFPPTSITTFNVFANWGLIIYMFMVGLEIDTKIMKRNAGPALVISACAMIAPFGLGCASSYAIYVKLMPDTTVKYSSFLLFVSVAMSITAFPVLARMLTENKMLSSRVGTMALSAAAVDDVVAWCVLALVVAIAKAAKPIEALYTFLLLLGFIAFMVVIVRPVLSTFANHRTSNSGHRYTLIIFLLVSIFVWSWFTEVIGVHAIFGAFVLGIVTPRKNRFAAEICERLEDLIVILLLPLYFTYSGLRTNITTLNNGTAWGFVVLVILTATIGKVVAGTLASRWMKCTWRESFTIGWLMNTKGLVELIVLNVGLDAKVLNTEIFTMFVIMALFNTVITNPIVYFLYLRNLPSEKEVVSEDTYSVVLAATSHEVAPWMLSTSSLFKNIKEKTAVKALLLSEISDRPSSYFFKELSSPFQDVPLLQRRKRKGLLSDMSIHAKLVGLDESQIHVKNLASSRLADDILQYTKDHNNSLIMFEMHHSFTGGDRYDVGNESTPRSRGQDLRQSVTKGVDTSIQKAFNFGASDLISRLSIKKADCTVAMLIHKTNASINKVDRILFLYNGEDYESGALEIVRSVKAPVHVTTVSKTGSIADDFTSIERPSFDDQDPREYDLIVMGASRDEHWEGYSSDAVQMSKVPVLLIYNSKNLDNIVVDDLNLRTYKDSSNKDDVSLPRFSHESGSSEESPKS